MYELLVCMYKGVPGACCPSFHTEKGNEKSLCSNSFWEYLCYFLSFQEMQALISKDLTREKEKEN